MRIPIIAVKLSPFLVALPFLCLSLLPTLPQLNGYMAQSLVHYDPKERTDLAFLSNVPSKAIETLIRSANVILWDVFRLSLKHEVPFSSSKSLSRDIIFLIQFVLLLIFMYVIFLLACVKIHMEKILRFCVN